MIKWRRVAGQAVFYGLFVAFVGYFSTSPAYVHMAPDRALIKLSFSHPGQPKAPCRERSAEELARLAPNMRIARDCARERSPVAIEFTLDGQIHYRELLPPTGFKRDGASTLYRRFSVPAGTHRIEVRLKEPFGTSRLQLHQAGGSYACPRAGVRGRFQRAPGRVYF